MNNVNLIGNLTRDVEFKTFSSGAMVAKIGLAVNRKYKKEGETLEEACFVEVQAWGKQAQLARDYLKKGNKIAITGSLRYQTWLDNEGKTRAKHFIDLERMQFLTSQNAEQNAHVAPAAQHKGPVEEAEIVYVEESDEIPF